VKLSTSSEPAQTDDKIEKKPQKSTHQSKPTKYRGKRVSLLDHLNDILSDSEEAELNTASRRKKQVSKSDTKMIRSKMMKLFLTQERLSTLQLMRSYSADRAESSNLLSNYKPQMELPASTAVVSGKGWVVLSYMMTQTLAHFSFIFRTEGSQRRFKGRIQKFCSYDGCHSRG